MMNKPDDKNANLTLGIELIDTNRKIKELLTNCTDLTNIRSIKVILDWEDGLLQHYRKYMKIRFYEPESKKFIEYKTYDEAMQKIQDKLVEKENLIEEDISNRIEYVYWLNRWSELLGSCFPKLNLVPLSRADSADISMLEEEEEEEDEVSSNGNEYTFPTQ